MRFRTVLSTALFLCSALPAVADTNVSGAISSNTTWSLANSPYVVTGAITVNSGVALTIEAGVTVKFNAGQWIDINGTLIATGTSASPITFTSSSMTPTAGSWNCVHFKPGSSTNSQLSYATVTYSGGWNAGVVVEGCSPTIDHVTVSNSSSDGIKVMGTSPAPTITNCTLTSNSSNGVNLTAGNSTVTGCTMSSNSGYGVNLTGGSTATISACTFTSNGNYAIGAEPNTTLLDLSNLTATGNGGGSKNAVGYRGGSITRTEQWSGSLPWEITGAVNLNAGFTLTINAGLTIKFAAGQWVNVYGTLLANGTEASPIVFTSNAANPAAGVWNCIHFFFGSSASRLSYTTVAYSGGYQAGLLIESSSPTVDHVTVSNCSNDGIKVIGTNPAPTITNCTLSSNSGYGINLIGGTTATISGCTFTSNGNYAIGAESNTTLLDLSNLTATGNGGGLKNAVGYRGGSITRTEQWSGSLPWEITGAVNLNAGFTLTIDAGMTIKFAAGQWLNVYGTLLANGTAVSPIVFTSNATSPAAGAWNCIHFLSGSSASRLSYTTVAYSGGYQAGLLIESSSPTLDHVTVSNCSNDGIKVLGTNPAPNITNCTLSSNSGYGVNLVAGNTATISVCTFTNNGNYAIGAESNITPLDLSNLTATGNGGGLKNAIGYRGGTITSAEQWSGSLPWEITGAVYLNAEVTLTINAGTTIKFAAGKWVDVYGTLVANGTAASPIVFTSNAVTPAAGAWNCIHFLSGSSASQLGYATVSYSGGYQAALVIDGSAPTFDHVTITNSLGAVKVNSGNPTLHHCAFINTGSGITNAGTAQINATLCYWNAADGPSTVGHGSGVSVSWSVTFDPWLAAAPSTPEYVSDMTVQSRAFNPSLSAYSTMTPTFALPANWTVTILNSSQTVLRSYTGSGQTANVTWDGKDGNGVTQSAGTYTFKVDGTATTGEVGTTARGVLLLTADPSQPTLSITSPSSGTTLSNVYQNGSAVVAVTGSLVDTNLHNWILDYGVGNNPTTWTTVAGGTANVQNAQFGSWDTLPITNGSYTLRLRSCSTYGYDSTATEPITLANFQFTQPASYQINATSGSLTYTSIIPFTLTETLVFKDASGNVARTLVNASRTAGRYNDSWNGRGDTNQYVPDGPYFYSVTVTDGTYTMTWDVSGQYIGGNIEYHDGLSFSAFDPFNNQPLTFTYTSSVAGLLYIAISPNDGYGNVAATCGSPNWCLVNGKYEEAGTHTVVWAGVDGNGALRLGKSLGCVTIPSSFPKNAIVVFGAKPSVTSVSVSPSFFSPNTGTQNLTFTLSTLQSQAATVTVTFLNQSSLSVLRTIQLANQAPGNVSVVWDGKADNGMLVAPGYYTITVAAGDSIGNQTIGQILTTVRY